jgi:hypothetical protein
MSSGGCGAPGVLFLILPNILKKFSLSSWLTGYSDKGGRIRSR